jgi:uncharacterized phage protein (TIGR01671 family)
MREILFRGKRIDNGEWVIGKNIICFKNSKTGEERFHIMPSGSQISASEDVDGNVFALLAPILHVTTSTIGQFTGLTDRNGKKIFEGDIVVVPLSGKPAKGIVEYFKTDICGFAVITQPQYSNYVLQKNYAYEVIGNIHDNPELLEVTE